MYRYKIVDDFIVSSLITMTIKTKPNKNIPQIVQHAYEDMSDLFWILLGSRPKMQEPVLWLIDNRVTFHVVTEITDTLQTNTMSLFMENVNLYLEIPDPKWALMFKMKFHGYL